MHFADIHFTFNPKGNIFLQIGAARDSIALQKAVKLGADVTGQWLYATSKAIFIG